MRRAFRVRPHRARPGHGAGRARLGRGASARGFGSGAGLSLSLGWGFAARLRYVGARARFSSLFIMIILIASLTGMGCLCDSSYTLKGDPSSSAVRQCGGKCLNGPSVTLSPASHIGNDPVRFHIHTTDTYIQSSSHILAILDSSSALPVLSRKGQRLDPCNPV